MYLLNLSTFHFPAQSGAGIRNIAVGGLLREFAAKRALSIAMINVTKFRLYGFISTLRMIMQNDKGKHCTYCHRYHFI